MSKYVWFLCFIHSQSFHPHVLITINWPWGYSKPLLGTKNTPPYNNQLISSSPIGTQHHFRNVQQPLILVWIKPKILPHFNTFVGKHFNQIHHFSFPGWPKTHRGGYWKRMETVWEVFAELSSNPGEPVTSPPSSPSTTQTIIYSTTQTSILSKARTNIPHTQPLTSGHLHHTNTTTSCNNSKKYKKYKKSKNPHHNHNSKEKCTYCHKHVPRHQHQTETSQKVPLSFQHHKFIL